MSHKKGAPAILVSDRQRKLLEKVSNRRNEMAEFKLRSKIILLASEGVNNTAVGRECGASLNKVKAWRRRWESAYAELCIFEKGNKSEVSDHELLGRIRLILSDRKRSGTPPRISLAQKKLIVALACEKPSKYGLPVTQWNRKLLAKVAIEQGIVETISERYISVILKK